MFSHLSSACGASRVLIGQLVSRELVGGTVTRQTRLQQLSGRGVPSTPHPGKDVLCALEKKRSRIVLLVVAIHHVISTVNDVQNDSNGSKKKATAQTVARVSQKQKPMTRTDRVFNVYRRINVTRLIREWHLSASSRSPLSPLPR